MTVHEVGGVGGRASLPPEANLKQYSDLAKVLRLKRPDPMN